MTKTLFITGCSGFIGRRLVARLAVDNHYQLYGLSRQPESNWVLTGRSSQVHLVKGDIIDTKIYGAYLAKCDTVVHLAAKTGKARPEEYLQTNTEGTRILIEACRRAGVKNFLYVSTIAVKYADKSNYYYAQSKELGEKLVRECGLNYIIIRPTIVIGKNSAIWKSLVRLANLPIPLIFGDGTAKIQPIDRDDLVECLYSILAEDSFHNQSFELGGPEVVSFDNFISKIYFAFRGQLPRTIVHIPLKPLNSFLSVWENYFPPVFPVTVGQLSAFSNDGTINSNQLFQQFAPHMRTIDEMIEFAVP